MIKPSGQMVYCTCSLQPEEGEQRIAQFLEKFSDFYRLPISAAEVGGDQALINAAGELRTTPADWPDSGGLDGFFAARLGRI
jgi:16S rRNA (cytosine967-C5)-methyltransferase